MEEQRQRAKPHKVMLDKRAHAMISGVQEVVSFDEKEVILETEQGTLTIKGEDLKVSRLTVEQGEVDIGGRMDSFVYSESRGRKAQGESFLGRLFK
ncbi:sporulation protein YabP [Lacrimispora sp. NSJ-141]|uniref:Sporulation protein YabP n=2 Tax=Lachnospiraceae TaxID=186803 RepID=A0A7G9G0J0_9FIRM|nr:MULTISPECIES: sporulation protein YabP [Lachnospiraceae]MCD2492223.1 sporulation protein YabP [Lientehia hominis]QNM04322.1 sporulation protein YabP [Qiania dongpingensis]